MKKTISIAFLASLIGASFFSCKKDKMGNSSSLSINTLMPSNNAHIHFDDTIQAKLSYSTSVKAETNAGYAILCVITDAKGIGLTSYRVASTNSSGEVTVNVPVASLGAGPGTYTFPIQCVFVLTNAKANGTDFSVLARSASFTYE